MKKVLLVLGLLLLLVNSQLQSQTYNGDIELYITNYINDIPGSSGNDFDKPTESELLTWQELMVHLLKDELTEARQKAAFVNYQIVEFEDNSLTSPASYYVVEEKSPEQHYWGTYILNRNPLRSQLIIQAPHPVYDSKTGLQAIFCFKNLGARAYFVSGTHRCNNSQFTTCSGTTSACSTSDTNYRISDNAHNVLSVFQKTTEVFSVGLPDTYYVQLHGFAKGDTDPYLIMSNGTRITPSPDYVSVLKNELYKIDNTLTFKLAHIDLSWSRLIATTNTQGRLLNNSPTPCTQNAASCSGRFIHIEQEKSKLRNDVFGWLKMYEALSYTFPEQPLSNNVNKISKESSAIVYPNPSFGFVHIQTKEPSLISIYTISGSCVHSVRYNDKFAEIDLTKLNSGIYLLKIEDEQHIETQKLMIR